MHGGQGEITSQSNTHKANDSYANMLLVCTANSVVYSNHLSRQVDWEAVSQVRFNAFNPFDV